MRPTNAWSWVLSLALSSVVSSAWGQGVISPSAGPINSAMAGASTAAPVDFGSTYWNPANLSGLDSQEVLIGSGLVFPSIHLNSSLQANSILGQFPPENRSGTTRSDSGVGSGLAVGAAFRLYDDSPVMFGLGIFGLVGGSVNFPGSFTTPVLTPRQPPNFFGVGPIYSNMALLAIVPSASYQITDQLAIAGGPVITSGTVSLNPAFFAANPKDQFGLASFPPATNSRPFWGGGFQLGLLYNLSDDWNLGFSYKSPIWQERWGYNSYAPDLTPRRIGVQANIPAIFSWGIAYKGLPKTLIDVDLRYIDYKNAALFGTKVVDGGLGWDSVFAVATGARYQATDRLALMTGYLYNTNPIREATTLFNVQAPGFLQNTFSLGATLRLTDNITLSTAWVHSFRNSIEGKILQIPGSSVRLDGQIDTLWTGLNITFGKARAKDVRVPAIENADGTVAAPPAVTMSSDSGTTTQ